MAGKPRSQSKPPKPPVESWKTTRELWERASSAEVELMRRGRPVNVEALWRMVKKYAPEEMQVETKAPKEFREALEHAGYKQLIDIRKRMIVVPALKDLGLLRELTGQAAYVAALSLMEDVLTNPERIPVSEKRQLAKSLMEMNLRLGGIKQEGEEEKGEGNLMDLAAAEQAERERVLSSVPEPYRELMGQKWDEERLRNLRTRQAIHQQRINEKAGHAKG